MKLMIDGVWRGDIMPPPELATKHMIHGGRFRHKITNDGSSAFPAEPSRYHLFVSYACPFAHRPLVVRALKWLDGIVPVSTLHPIWNMPDGWASGDTPLSTPDGGGNGFRFLHEAYRAANPTYTGKIIVPVLMGRTLATDRQQRVDGDREDVERRVRNGRRRVGVWRLDAFCDLGAGQDLAAYSHAFGLGLLALGGGLLLWLPSEKRTTAS
jgi:glutathionyl-hydroquinone reductase